jgi:hypothetical protein
MSLLEDVVVISQRHMPLNRLVWRKRVKLFKGLQMSPSTHLHRYRPVEANTARECLYNSEKLVTRPKNRRF